MSMGRKHAEKTTQLQTQVISFRKEKVPQKEDPEDGDPKPSRIMD